MAEDLDRQLFGLPQRYQDSVEAIQPGLPLFLYNYSTRCLHGVFEASSDGGLNIEPEAWDTKETRKAGRPVSRFPAQVRVRWREERPPLEEEQFRPFLYHYDGPKFRLELSVKEANDLLKLFGTSSIQKTEKWQDDMGGEWERVKSKSKVTRVYRPPTKRSNSPNPPAGRRRAGSSNGSTNNNNGNASQSGVPTTTSDFGRGRESRADIAQKWRSDPDLSVASSSSSADVSTSSCVTHDDDNRSKKGVKKNGMIQVEANGIISVPNELPELQDASLVVVDLKGSEHHTNVSCEDSSERDSRADSDELHTELIGVRSNSQAGESQAGSQSPSRPGFASYSAALKAGMVGMFTDLSIGGDGLNFGGGVEIGDSSVNVVPSSINGAGSKAVVESGGNRRLVCNEGSGAPKLHNVVGGSEGTPTTACGNGDGKKVDNRKLGSDKEVTGLGATSTAAGAVERVLQNEGECVGRMSEGSNSSGTSAAAVEYAGASVQKLSKNVSRPIEGERVVDRASSNYRARSSGGKLSADSTEYTATEIAQKSHSWQGVDAAAAAAAVLSHPQVFSWGPNIRIMSSTVLPLDHCPDSVNSSSEGGLQKSSVSDSTMSAGKNARQTSSPGIDGHQTLWQAGEQFETASPAVVYPSFPAQHLKASAHFQVPLSKTNRSVHDRRRGQQYDLPKERDELTQLARTSSLDQVPPQSLMPLRLPTPSLQPQQNFHYSTLSPAPPTAQYHDWGVRSDVGPHGMAYHYVTRSPVEGDLVMQNGVVQGICGVPPSPTTITLQSTPPLAGDGLFPLVPAQLLANAEELHMEILEFARTASLSPEARIYAEAAVECVRNAVKILWPCADVEVFGSYATGLSLAHSDVDVVVVDAPPPPGTADAVPLYGSRALAPLIRLLGSSLQVYPWCVDINTIESATMPVIKLQCKPTVNGASAPQASVVKIDITIGGKRVKNVEATGGVQGNGVTGSNNNNNNNQVVGMPNVNKSASILHNGTATREYVIEKLHQQPALAPLVLLLKSYLQAKGLKDVYTGGLGSFSLTIMVVFYLERTSILYGMPGGVRPQVLYTGSGDAPNSSSADQLSPDGVVVVPSVTTGGTLDAHVEDPTSSATSTTASNRTSTFSSPTKESLANGGIVEQLQKSMHTVSSPNLGILLIDFLHIFGVEIDFTKVRLVTKGNGGSGGLFYHDKQLRSAALTIDDPLRPGNNIGAGSFKMHDVQTALKSMLQILTSPPPVASSQRVGMGPGKRRPLPLIDQLFTTSNTFLAPQ